MLVLKYMDQNGMAVMLSATRSAGVAPALNRHTGDKHASGLGGLCPGGLCPDVLCPGGLCLGGLCPGGSLSREIFVQGGLCPGISVWGVSV